MKKLPIVALIGQTNAGKSSLLNRFAHKNIAIVAREEGTTRDNVMTRIDNRFLMIDTAGLKDPNDEFEAGIQDQIADAIDSAEVILLTLDSSKYPDDKDKQIAKNALKSRKPVLLILNKSDLGESLPDEEFLRLGVKPEQTFRVSATTGFGIKNLKSAILNLVGALKGSPISRENLATEPSQNHDPHGSILRGSPSLENGEPRSQQSLKIALIGRPNVGKSSLFNSLGHKQQALVSSRQGTTRDVNRVEVRYHGRTLEILDTAGLRKPGKREVGIEKFSALRTLAAIEEADICALLIDATEPHSKLDQTLAGQIIDAGKGIIIILTKADLVNDTDEILDKLEYDFNFIPYAPVLITSSETGQNVTKLFELATEIDVTRHQEIKTSDLNKILSEAVIEHPPAGLKNTRPKLKYIVQTDTCPPWFVVHGRDLGLLHWSYKRFLERKIREKYPFVGTPIMFSYRNDQPQSKRRGFDPETYQPKTDNETQHS
jgi:GTP-binding protein